MITTHLHEEGAGVPSNWRITIGHISAHSIGGYHNLVLQSRTFDALQRGKSLKGGESDGIDGTTAVRRRVALVEAAARQSELAVGMGSLAEDTGCEFVQGHVLQL